MLVAEDNFNTSMHVVPGIDEGTEEGGTHECVSMDGDVRECTFPITDGIREVTWHFQLIGVLLVLNGKTAPDHDH